MKTSFYFVLWITSTLVIELFCNAGIRQDSFFIALVCVVFIHTLCNEYFSNRIEFQQERENVNMMEIYYQNDYAKLLRITSRKFFFETLNLVYLILALVLTITYDLNNIPWFLVIFVGGAILVMFRDWFTAFKYYKGVKSEKMRFMPYEYYQIDLEQYAESRQQYTYEQLLPQPTWGDKLFRLFNLFIAIVSILYGIGFIFLFAFLKIRYDLDTTVVITCLAYGSLALLFGLSDFISTYNGYTKKY